MIFVHHGPGAIHFVRMGYVNALQELGHRVIYVSHDDENYTKYLKEYKPTHIIGSTWEINPNHLDAILDVRPKFILRASEWSEYALSIGPPLCLVTNQEKEVVKTLVHHGLLKTVNTYYTNTYLSKMIGGWSSLCNIASSLLAADTHDYYYIKTSKIFDFSFIGGWWPYKAPYLKWIVSLSELFNGVVYGGSAWPCPAYRGGIDNRGANTLFNQSMICPNVMEPIAVKYHFDVNERTYKTCATKTFSLIQYTDSVEEIFYDNVDYFESEEELISKTEFYLNHPDLTEKIAQQGYNHVINNHTYLHRVKEFLSDIY